MAKECMNDLLKKFKDTTEPEQNPGADSTKVEVGAELNLGLSLGGCFGGKPKNESSSLFRSASSSEAFMKEEVEDVPLTRTSSLPSEPLDARKRKGLLSMMQMDSGMSKKKSGAVAGAGEELNPLLRSAPGSIGSLGSGSSASSFPDYESAHGSGNHRGPRSPASVLPLREQKEQKPTVIPSAENANTDVATRSKNADSLEKPDPVRQESEAKVMADMPCVFTIGDGPNGKRIEGLLFKYKTGEDVKIVCVCHGTFLSPAEFVKHAGGSEVEHPLRRIVVVVPTALSSSS